MARTKVIAIEGIDGSGKSLQFSTLRDTLIRRGLRVATREYPNYDSHFGSQVGRYLSAAEGVRADDVDGKSMALWYALDRFEDLQSFRDGEAEVLIINRYVLSNAVYQSIRDIDLNKPDIVDWVFDLEYEHFHLPKADIFLFYDVSTAQAEENVKKKGFRAYVGGEAQDVYEQSRGIQERSRAKYLECVQKREDIAVIPCMRGDRLLSVEEIAAVTLQTLEARGIIPRAEA